MSSFKRVGIAADHVNRHPAMRQEVINVYPQAKFHDAAHRIGEDELIAFLQACDIKDYADFYSTWHVTPVSFDELLARSEVLTLHLPKTPKTLGLYSRAVLGKLRPDCVLINTCRGGIVDEAALLERLDSGALTAACFDVFAVEPAENDRLLRHPNILATPPIGARTQETRPIPVR